MPTLTLTEDPDRGAELGANRAGTFWTAKVEAIDIVPGHWQSRMPYEEFRVDSQGRRVLVVSSTTWGVRELRDYADRRWYELMIRQRLEAIAIGGRKGAAARHAPEHRAAIDEKHAAWSHYAAKLRQQEPAASTRAIASRVAAKYAGTKYAGSDATIRRHLSGSAGPHRSSR